MAKKTRAQRKQQGGQRSNRRKAQSQSKRSNANSRVQSQPAVDASASLAVAAPKEVSRPASRTTKAATKGKTPNVKRQSVNWQKEYSNVVDDLHMLMIVSIFLFIVIIGAGSFIT